MRGARCFLKLAWAAPALFVTLNCQQGNSPPADHGCPPVSSTADPAEARGTALPAGVTACIAWRMQVCYEAGEKSWACTQAEQAAELLPEAACVAALAEIPATLAKAKAARSACTQLITQLCTDIGKDSGVCKMVTQRTETFPPGRCEEMLDNYEKVLAQLKTMEERGGPKGDVNIGGATDAPASAAPAPNASPLE